MTYPWQEINEGRRCCHSWRDPDERRIAAMTTLTVLLVLLVLAVVLVRYARHDHFAGPADRADDHDELGPVDLRRHLVPRT
jgi:hypothetical protein